MPLRFDDVHIKEIWGQTVGASDAVQFVGNVNRYQLPYEDKNYLFVGDNNTLYWAKNDGTALRGFRAYFKIPTSGLQATPKGARARIVTMQKVTTGVDSIQSLETGAQKIIRDGKVYILRDGHCYTILGEKINW
jgi:hypothetical protein